MERQTARPSAWMISLYTLLPRGKSCSQCGSIFLSRNGSFLPSAEGSVYILIVNLQKEKLLDESVSFYLVHDVSMHCILYFIEDANHVS